MRDEDKWGSARRVPSSEYVVGRFSATILLRHGDARAIFFCRSCGTTLPAIYLDRALGTPPPRASSCARRSRATRERYLGFVK
jgi:hypothetical protein